MLKLYYHPSPNPLKIALFLEETGLAYETIPVDTRKGEQFDPEFLKLNPNAKTPVLVDGETVVFDSNAMLLYLAEKTGQFLPPKEQSGEALSWLMFIATGVGPYSGQAVHFKRMAPEKIEYAIDRYQFEAERHWGIVDDLLATRRYMLGETYTIVDMSLWGWARVAGFVLDEDKFEKLTHVKRWRDEISARPAAERAEAVKGRHVFQGEVDAAAMKVMFRYLD